MKKIKIIMISLLGVLLLVPFMRFSRAQPPSYVGVAVDDHYEWDQNIYIGDYFELWDTWFADNMTAFWTEPFGHYYGYANMDAHYWLPGGKAGPTNPIYILHANISEIIPDTGGIDANDDGIINATEQSPSPGTTLIQVAAGTYDVGNAYLYPYNTPYLLGGNASQFAEYCWYGGMFTVQMWVTNGFNYAGSQSAFFAPTTIDWTDFAVACNAGLDTMWGISSTFGYTLTVSALTNGFTMTSPVMGFGNNSEIITITTTYNAEGVLSYYSWEYGSDLFMDVVLVDIDDPVVDAPDDFTVTEGYSGETIEWTATDASPKRYGVLQDGGAVGSLNNPWQSGTPIVFDVPEDLAVGDYLFRIVLVDYSDNSAYDELVLTVKKKPDPIPGFDISIVIGILTFATIGIIIHMKKKK